MTRLPRTPPKRGQRIQAVRKFLSPLVGAQPLWLANLSPPLLGPYPPRSTKSVPTTFGSRTLRLPKSIPPMVGLLALLSGCDDMTVQPKAGAYSPDAMTVVAAQDTVSWTDAPQHPPALTLALLQRGQERFRINCTPCHSELGDGHGMVVQRGFPAPPSYHIDRLRDVPTQHFYDVITHGYGAMYSFAGRVAPADRWAIAAYIRALQLSQNPPPGAIHAEQAAR